MCGDKSFRDFWYWYLCVFVLQWREGNAQFHQKEIKSSCKKQKVSYLIQIIRHFHKRNDKFCQELYGLFPSK